MTQTLQHLLLNYIRENNPALLTQLRKDDALHAWVCDKIQEVEMVLNQSKPGPVNEHQFFDILIMDLQPSRFRYVRDLFETEFSDEYERMMEAGTLNYELVNMVSACHPLFEEFPLIEDMDNPQMDHAVANLINDYLNSQYE